MTCGKPCYRCGGPCCVDMVKDRRAGPFLITSRHKTHRCGPCLMREAKR